MTAARPTAPPGSTASPNSANAVRMASFVSSSLTLFVLEEDLLEIGVRSMAGDQATWLFDISLVRDLRDRLDAELDQLAGR